VNAFFNCAKCKVPLPGVIVVASTAPVGVEAGVELLLLASSVSVVVIAVVSSAAAVMLVTVLLASLSATAVSLIEGPLVSTFDAWITCNAI
jgi:hypothetical protein